MTKQIFLPSDGPTGTPSLRTLGTGALQAAAGNDSRLSDSRLPLLHASTHLGNGSDDLSAILRGQPGPAIYGHLASAFDPVCPLFNFNLNAGAVFQAKILTTYAFTINTIDLVVVAGGTGVTALANCFCGIYDSGGTRRFVSADQSSSWNTAGTKSLAVSGGYAVTANDFIYIALLVGTQATTPVTFLGSGPNNSAVFTINLSAATYRSARQLSSQTSLPTSLTLSSNAVASGLFWAGVR